jgi:hypothetical protein
MKTALAFVCSLMLAMTNVVIAQAPDVSVVSAAPSCHCGKKTGCCAAKHSLPKSSPVSAAPVSSQTQFSLVAPATVAWALPGVAPRELASSVSPFLTTIGTAVFARNCARLI